MDVIVARYFDPIEAQIARGLLLAEGIEAYVGDDQTALANWEWRLAIGGTKLRVPAAQAQRARDVLKAMDAGAYAIDDEGEPAPGLAVPDRETTSSRLAWVSAILFGLPLPWRRRDGDHSDA